MTATARRERLGLTAALLVFAALASVLSIRTPDLFWHLAAGRWMLDHHQILDHDPFRFTSAGSAWVDHEWLFQVLAAAIERTAGLDGLGLLRVVVGVALALTIAAVARRAGAHPAVAAVLAAIAVIGVRARLFLRPEIFTFVGLALLLWGLDAYRREPRPRRAWALLLLVALWSNFHPGVLLAPVLISVFLVGSRLAPQDRDRQQPRWWAVVLLPLSAIAALGANPWGWHILGVPGAIGGALAGLELTNPDWAPAWVVPRPFFFALLVGWLVVTLVAWRRRQLDPPSALVALATLPLAILFVRNQPLFAIAATVSLAHSLAPWRPRRATLGAAGLLAAASVWCLVFAAEGRLAVAGVAPRAGWGLEPGLFPAGLVDEIASRGDLGNLYHDPVWGGYLLWRTHPPRQVFIDTRNEVGPELLRELARARTDAAAWNALLEHWAIDAALVRYDPRRVPILEPDESGALVRRGEATLHQLLFPAEEFAVLDFDDRAMLLVRRTPERAAELERREYRVLHPENLEGSLAAATTDPTLRLELEAELARKLSADPHSQRARRLAEVLATTARPEPAVAPDTGVAPGNISR